jgi:hypothetical protein
MILSLEEVGKSTPIHLQNLYHKFHYALEHVYIKIHINLKCYFSIPCNSANKLFPLIYPEYFVPRFRTDETGTLVWFPAKAKLSFLFSPNPKRPNRLWEPPNSRSVGAGVLPPGVRRPRREADHSPPSRTESRKKWNFAPSFHGVHNPAIYNELSPPRAASVGCPRLPDQCIRT